MCRLVSEVQTGSALTGYQMPQARPELLSMPDHDVRMATKNLLIRGIDLEFLVKVDRGVLGTLSVSEGGLHWRPKNATKERGVQISWSEFADWAES